MRLIIGTLLMVLWVSSMLLLPGCGPSEAEATQAAVPRDLSFTITNRTGDKMKSIGVEGGKLPMSFRDLAEGQSATLKSKKLDLPETLTIHWSSERGDRKEATANLWGELGASYTGPVNLTLNARGKIVLSGG